MLGWMRGAWLASALGVAAVAAIACRSAAFVCSDDEQCGAGMCQSVGYCSFPDASCDSGQRYGELASSELAGECVDPQPDEDSSSAGTTVASTNGGTSSVATHDGTSDDSASTAGGSVSTAGAETVGADSAGSETTTGATADSGDSDTGPGLRCPDYLDDFEDGVIGAQWELHHPEFVVETGGVLQIIVDPPIGPFVGAILIESFDLSQGWFRAELDETPDSSYTQQDVEVFNADDLDESLLILVEGNELIARYRPLGGGFENIIVIGFLPSEHVWLQLRGDGDTMHFETSPDGITFESFASYDSPFALSNVRVGLRASNYVVLPAEDIVSFREIAVCTHP
jgi:hypothetical protein